MRSISVVLGVVAIGALVWSGCGGSSTELVTDLDAGGAGGSDASAGGSGGVGGSGGSGGVGGSGGIGGTGGVGGTGGTGGVGGIAGTAGVAGEAGSDAGLEDGSPGGMAGSGGDASVDAPPACLIIGQDCDTANDTCCDPLFCDDSVATPRCRPQFEDGGPSCAPPNQPCTMISCCPGLVCQPVGPTEICRFEEPDGGLIDAAIPDANACMDLYEPCGGGLGNNCCDGLECKKMPPAFPDRTCLPIDAPDANMCPSQEPTSGEPCSVIGLQCSYSMMTVCTCFSTGWMCAY